MLTAVPAPQALAPSKPLRVTAADTQSAASPPRRLTAVINASFPEKQGWRGGKRHLSPSPRGSSLPAAAADLGEGRRVGRYHISRGDLEVMHF